MEEKLNELANELACEVMRIKYPDFDLTTDISEDEQMSKEWEVLTETIFGYIWEAFDEGMANED